METEIIRWPLGHPVIGWVDGEDGLLIVVDEQVKFDLDDADQRDLVESHVRSMIQLDTVDRLPDRRVRYLLPRVSARLVSAAAVVVVMAGATAMALLSTREPASPSRGPLAEPLMPTTGALPQQSTPATAQPPRPTPPRTITPVITVPVIPPPPRTARATPVVGPTPPRPVASSTPSVRTSPPPTPATKTATPTSAQDECLVDLGNDCGLTAVVLEP